MDAFTAYNGILIRVGLYLLIFWPTVGYYVYSDSKQRGASNPIVRGILVGFLGIPGVVWYVVWRQRNHQ